MLERVRKHLLMFLSAADFTAEQMRKIDSAISLAFDGYDVVNANIENTLIADIPEDARALQMFFVAKKIEGMSEKSLAYYQIVLRKFFTLIQKPLPHIKTDDIRFYLASNQKLSLTTVNNERRILLSFFNWLTTEEYIIKNPVARIKNVKEPKVVKKPFTDTEIEELRDAIDNHRDLAILALLVSTGMRNSEMCGLNVSDVDFVSGEVIVKGKGSKERICYLNEIAKKRIKDYLSERSCVSDALFTSCDKSGRRLQSGGVGTMLRQLGVRAGVENVHAHRFRRTAATKALNRGMPVEQVQKMLGHEKIDTTMRYAIAADNALKHSHEKYM